MSETSALISFAGMLASFAPCCGLVAHPVSCVCAKSSAEEIRRPQCAWAAMGYTSLLQAAQVQISMSARGRPIENAFAELFMRTLKEEGVSLNEYEDLTDALAHLTHFLDQVYQHNRMHSSLSYLTPAELEAHWNTGFLETSGS